MPTEGRPASIKSEQNHGLNAGHPEIFAPLAHASFPRGSWRLFGGEAVMPYSLQCHFDDATDRHIRRIWSDLKEAGLPSRPIDSGFFPHLTFILGESDSPNELQDILLSAETIQQEFGILFTSLSTFANDAGVIFLGPVVTSDLLDIHQKLWMIFQKAFLSVNPFYVPHRWFPHCSLATRLSRDQADDAFGVLSALDLPFSARCISLNLVKYPESLLLQSKPLNAEPAGPANAAPRRS